MALTDIPEAFTGDFMGKVAEVLDVEINGDSAGRERGMKKTTSSRVPQRKIDYTL